VASIPHTAPAGQKKYVPSEKQRAEDERIKERLNRLTGADLKRFDKLLKKAITPENRSG
jgi:hypothetical protein